MEVFRAETGKLFDQILNEPLSVEQRSKCINPESESELEQLSGVPISSQILITGAGIQLRDDIDVK
ncbi:2955_t:CDS:2, partial [Dentiscutata erythropus]